MMSQRTLGNRRVSVREKKKKKTLAFPELFSSFSSPTSSRSVGRAAAAAAGGGGGGGFRVEDVWDSKEGFSSWFLVWPEGVSGKVFVSR